MNRALVLVNVTGLIVGISYGLHNPILPLFAKNMVGASYSDLGLIGVANFLPYMVVPLFVGMLLDRFNNGHLLAVGAVTNAASVYLLSVAQSVPEIMTYRVINGIAHAFFWPPCESIISNESSEGRRVRNIAWFTMFFVIGLMTGPLLGTVLLEGLDLTYRVLFEITAFIMAAAIVTSIRTVKNFTRRISSRLDLSAIVQMRRTPEAITLVIFCTAAFGVILAIYPAFLDDSGIDEAGILYLYFIFGISRVVSLGLGGVFARRTSQTLIVSVAIMTAGFLISAVGGSFAVFAVAMLLMGAGFSVLFPLILEIILSGARREASGGIIGAFETVFGIGWAVGPAIAGPMSQSFGVSAPYWILGLSGIFICMLAVIRRRQLEPYRMP